VLQAIRDSDPLFVVSRETAEKIVAAHVAFQAANDQNGEWTNNRWHLVGKPLSETVFGQSDACEPAAEPSP
jgi:hypothetical protein